LGLDHQWLHAVKLGFQHPITGEQVSFESEYPKHLALVLANLRG
jgi:23S rRNA pseudouridine1911/1915/1917 synthase